MKKGNNIKLFMDNMRIKSKQYYRSISNRDTPINMLKLKIKYIEELKNKVLIPKRFNYHENNQDEVNYAEDRLESGVRNILNYTNSAIEMAINEQETNVSTPVKRIKQHSSNILSLVPKGRIVSLKNDLIPNVRTEQVKIRLRLNYEFQKIYQKVYFVKQMQKLIRINKKQIRKMEYQIDAPYFNSKEFKDYNSQDTKKEFVKAQQTRNYIKQNDTYQSKSIKYKTPSYIKEKEKVTNDIKEYQQIQTKMKENYKKNYVNKTNKTKKVVSKTEKAKKLEGIIATSTKRGIGTTIIGAAGGLVIIIVLIIVMISAFLETSVGFLFSDDSIDIEAGDISIGNAIEIIEQEVDDKVEEIKTKTDYDKLLIYGMTPYWKDILSIYAVLGSSRENIDITSMKEENLKFLRKVFWEVCEIDWDTTTYTVKHVYTVDGETVVEYEERVKLEITLNTMDLDEMVGKYSLSNKEHEQLMELQKPEYEEMWAKLLARG